MPRRAAHTMQSRPVVVIGAGVGGLACALDLAARGVPVELIEGAGTVGGKLREVPVGGRALDSGPTVFTMRWVFDELFDRLGERLDDHLGLAPASILARHAWTDEACFDLHADLAQSLDAIARFAGAAEAGRYAAFCERARGVYAALERPFLRGSRPNPLSLLARAGWHGLPAMLRIAPFESLWSALGEHFHDARLRQLFGRYATYCGSSPFLAPATLMLVAHVERAGVWLVEGGMQRIADSLARLAVARGVRLRCGEPVAEVIVRDGHARAVRLESGAVIEADGVVFNGDAAAIGAGLLGTQVAAAVAPQAAPRSLSAVTWAMVAGTRGLPLLRHNVCFGADSAAEFDDLFVRAVLPQDPTVYVCAQDRGAHDDAPAPDGTERLLCLVNAPALAAGGTITSTEIQRCETRMFQRLAHCGLTVSMRHPPVVTTPADFAQRFPGSRGALYGPASHGWKASFTRPGARTKVAGLYLAGGTVHPGPGVPMAALSGRLAAASLMHDRAADRSSTSRWRPAATPGGTSTR